MNFSFHEHVALFGGSFNPPHVGHVKAAHALLSDPKVANVIMLPSYGNPLKKAVTAYADRFEMAKLAFTDLKVSRFEEEEKIEFTWQLLEKMATRHTKIAFVIGTDQFADLERWGRFPEVLGLSDWIVLLRRPSRVADSEVPIQNLIKLGILQSTSDRYTFQVRAGGQSRILRFVETAAPLVSSTHIREQFALGNHEAVHHLLPESVYAFIERKKLYGT